jgi:hypothetical protein
VSAPLPLAAKTTGTGRGTKKATPKSRKKAPTKDIVPAINGGGLIDRTQVVDMVASVETATVSKEGGRRVLRSRKGFDNAYQEAETQLTRALTAANRAQKARRSAAHLALA